MPHPLLTTASPQDLRAAPDASADIGPVIEALRAAFALPGLSHDQTQRLAALAEQAAWTVRRRRQSAALDRMARELRAQTEQIRALSSRLAHERRATASALTAGRAGLWECRLDDERLTWTEGVYELFGLPVGSRLRRNEVLARYARPSLLRLEDVRSAALSSGDRFRLDAEIETGRGERRWIRVSAAVERRGGAPYRLYGMKQDVTEERAHAEEVARLAETDALTDLPNRRLFRRRLAELSHQPDALLILVDLDGFKAINDRLGHQVGDAVLQAVAARLRIAGRDAAVIARIGGDEFALAFDVGLDRIGAERRARRIVDALRMPVEGGGVMLTLGASAGLARSRGASPDDWVARADRALYAAKASGRDGFRSEDDPIAGAAA